MPVATIVMTRLSQGPQVIFEKSMFRSLEIIFALILLPFIVVLLAPCFIFIVFESGGPVIFRSKRLGRDKTLFTIYKLRTMTTEAPLMPSSCCSVACHVTKVGGLLRSYSLDELPQLFNIINGTMSFVGPRPCLPSEVELVDMRSAYGIFSLRPGLTGIAQIKGRDSLTIINKVRFENLYLRNRSVILDAKIIILTIICLFRTGDVSH